MNNCKSICFIGLDGSGKSTCIEFANKWCLDRGINIKIVRAAYVIEKSNFLIKVGKKIVLRKHSNPFKKDDYSNYLNKMRSTNTKSLRYRIFSAITTHEFKHQIRNRITKNLKKGTNLLIDRYIFDNAVTYAANLGLNEDFIVETISKKWKKAPFPTKIIYIKTPVNVCMARKNDIPDELYLKVREPLYDFVAKKYNAKVISGEQNIDNMYNDIEKVLSEVFYG